MVATHAGLRDRALIGLMVYSFARIGAALGMAVGNVYTQNRRLWVRLREKGVEQRAHFGRIEHRSLTRPSRRAGARAPCALG